MRRQQKNVPGAKKREDEETEEESEEYASEEGSEDGGDEVERKKGLSGKAKKSANAEEEDDDEEEETRGARRTRESGDGAKKTAKGSAGGGEVLPPNKPPAREVSLRLPGHGEKEVAVSVRLSAVAPIVPLKRSWPHGEADEKNDDEEKEEDEEEGEEEDEEGEGVQRNQKLCPPWLPHLLSDDVFYWERTLLQMYGYAAPPPPPFVFAHKDSTERKSTENGKDTDGELGHEEEDLKTDDHDKMKLADEVSDDREKADKEEVVEDIVNEKVLSGVVRKVSDAPIASPSLWTPSVSGGVERKLSMANISGSTARIVQARKSQKPLQLPPLKVLRFPDANRIFFLVRAASGEKWYLLDTLPKRHKESKMSARNSGAKPGADNDDEDDTDNNNDDEEEEGEEEEEEEEENEAAKEGDWKGDTAVGGDEKVEEDEETDDGIPTAKNLDMGSVICIDALMLAALQSPTALRCCVSQREPLSFACIEQWLRIDLHAAMPLFTTIHRMMLSVYVTGQSRLPYELPGAVMDFNFFFTATYLNHRLPTYPRLHVNTPISGQRVTAGKDEISFVGEEQSIETMKALLGVRTRPSRRILLRHLESVVGIRMLLWLLMQMPKELLLSWGTSSSVADDGDVRNYLYERENTDFNALHDDEEDEEDEDEEGYSRRRVSDDAALANAFMRRVLGEDGPRFFPSPFLLTVVLEIRHRLQLEDAGDAPSVFTLLECVGHKLLQRIEDGKPQKDPLLVSSFSLLPEAISKNKGELSCQPRRQRLYQSDLVMLLLVLTTTKTRRNVVSQDVVRSRTESVVVRSRSLQLSACADGNQELLQYLLRKKTEKVRTPTETAESGYFRLLYLCLMRFKCNAALSLVLSMTPLFAVLGPHDCCPFGDLVQAWSLEKDPTTNPHLNLFIDTFWNELFYRLLDGQFDDATLAKGRALLLTEKVQERRKSYMFTLRQLLFPVRTSSFSGLSAFSLLTSPSCASTPPQKGPLTRSFCDVPPPKKDDTLVREYSDEYFRGEEQTRHLFELLPMAPRTYLTPETVFILLFRERCPHVHALRYLMIKCRVVTVHANPLKDIAMPAMEYALRKSDTYAIKMLLSIGVTLRDHIDGGNVASDMMLCEAVLPKDADALLERWRQRERQREKDPAVMYGILCTVPNAP